jgi:hypothetical protein
MYPISRSLSAYGIEAKMVLNEDRFFRIGGVNSVQLAKKPVILDCLESF